jgi:hypothetical protein
MDPDSCISRRGTATQARGLSGHLTGHWPLTEPVIPNYSRRMCDCGSPFDASCNPQVIPDCLTPVIGTKQTRLGFPFGKLVLASFRRHAGDIHLLRARLPPVTRSISHCSDRVGASVQGGGPG